MLQRRLPLLLAIFMVAAFVLTLLVILLLRQSDAENCLSATVDCVADVAELLIAADPALAPALLEEKACLACHNLPSIAPPLEIVGVLAASRRPPLSAAAYLYESLVYPNAFIVEGYNATMPIPTLEPAELGALIAYLLGEAE